MIYNSTKSKILILHSDSIINDKALYGLSNNYVKY